MPQDFDQYWVQVESAHSSITSTPPPSSNSPFEAAPVHNAMPNSSGAIDIFFLHSPIAKENHASSDSNPYVLHFAFLPMPPNSKASFFTNEEMPSLTPPCPYVLPHPKTPPDKPQLVSAKCDNTNETIPLLTPSKSSDVIFDTLPYLGLSHADGRTTIMFKGLTHSQAQYYLLTSPLAQYYHSLSCSW
ncbi:hypothetical protein EDD22DRAFT_955804 [Suillus occidentalis]|nr:hypothetical protein EDD22DRAFT_955804 [Suillus occidentalis]